MRKRKRIKKIVVAIIMMFTFVTTVFAGDTGCNEKVQEEITKKALDYVIEYREIMYGENQIWVAYHRKGDSKTNLDYYHEWEAEEFFKFFFETKEEFDFILTGRIFEDGKVKEEELKFELAPLFTVVDELVPPNPKKMGVLRKMIYDIEKNKKNFGWNVKTLPELGDDCYLVEVFMGEITEPETTK